MHCLSLSYQNFPNLLRNIARNTTAMSVRLLHHLIIFSACNVSRSNFEMV